MGFYSDASSGYNYATIDGTSYSSASPACQSGYYNMPIGWELAPPDSNGIRMATEFRWGTNLLVYSNGASYWTTGSGRGQLYASGRNFLTTSTLNGAPAYGVSACHFRVLIRAPLSCRPPLSPCEEFRSEGSDQVTIAMLAQCQGKFGITASEFFEINHGQVNSGRSMTCPYNKPCVTGQFDPLCKMFGFNQFVGMVYMSDQCTRAARMWPYGSNNGCGNYQVTIARCQGAFASTATVSQVQALLTGGRSWL